MGRKEMRNINRIINNLVLYWRVTLLANPHCDQLFFYFQMTV